MIDTRDMLINPQTAEQLAAFIKQPAHGLLLSGPRGSGKKFLAVRLTAALLGTTTSKLDTHPYFLKIAKEEGKSEISIDAARELIKKLSLRVAENQGRAVNRVALIADAGTLSTEAQNAVLKLLEEPPAGSLLILTADTDTDLLPTVVSRLQKIAVRPAGLTDSQAYWENSHQTAEIASAWMLSGGSPGLMSALLDQAQEHPLKVAVAEAKEFIQMNKYQRVTLLRTAAKDKEKFELFLEALAKVLRALQQAAIDQNKPSNSDKILQTRQAVDDALNSQRKNTNLRLLALSLASRIAL